LISYPSHAHSVFAARAIRDNLQSHNPASNIAVISTFVDDVRFRFNPGAFSQESICAGFDGVIEESVVYFDHGIGSVNLVIHATLKKGIHF
jgi:hypothetical protein